MRRRDVRLPVLAFSMSLLVHAMLLIALPLAIDAATPHHEQSRDTDEKFEPMALPVEVRLGIDAPAPPSDTWLGDAEAEPHLAEHAPMDQMAFAEENVSAEPPPPSPPQMITEVSQPLETAEADAEALPELQEETAELARAPEAEPTSQPLEPPPVDAPPRDVEAIAESLKQLIELIQEALTIAAAEPPLQQAQSPPQETPPNEAVDEPQHPQPQPSESPPEIGTPSDKQSTPTSLIDVPREQWHLGRPLASQGLTLKPRRPHFELLTMLTAAPGNPLCLIEFGRDGVPISAALLRSSGDARVDEAVLASLYRWRAEGAALEDLPEGQSLEVQMRILLTRRKVD